MPQAYRVHAPAGMTYFPHFRTERLHALRRFCVSSGACRNKPALLAGLRDDRAGICLFSGFLSLQASPVRIGGHWNRHAET
jgi:hypothetical protein